MGFIEGWPPGQAESTESSLTLRFLVDDWSGPATVTFTQHGDELEADVTADNEPRALEQAMRVLSLDHDGTGYAELEDPIVRELQRKAGYLRPVLFHSPYECAALSILSARTSRANANRLRDALSPEGAFATPRQLLELQELKGLPANKIPRLHGIAEAALEGRLDRERLMALEDPVNDLQTLPGIGPFYATLIYVRACGPTDAPPPQEPRLHEAVQQLYQRPVEDVAENWRPFRTWVSVLIRATHE